MVGQFTYDTDRVSPSFTTVGLVYMPNGCCKDQPVLITKNYMRGGDNYSCQCACGIWCTTGHPTVAGAIKDYQTMSNGGIPMVDNY